MQPRIGPTFNNGNNTIIRFDKIIICTVKLRTCRYNMFLNLGTNWARLELDDLVFIPSCLFFSTDLRGWLEPCPRLVLSTPPWFRDTVYCSGELQRNRRSPGTGVVCRGTGCRPGLHLIRGPHTNKWHVGGGVRCCTWRRVGDIHRWSYDIIFFILCGQVRNQMVIQEKIAWSFVASKCGICRATMFKEFMLQSVNSKY